MLDRKEEWTGFFAGLAITVPWLGRVIPIPSSAVALLFIPAACAVLVLCRSERIQIRRGTVYILLAILLYFAFVIQSATVEQLEFFLSPSKWMASESHYYSAKLLKFSLSFFPAIVAGLCISLLRDKDGALHGLFLAIVAVAAIAALNVTRHYQMLFATNYEEAAEYFGNAYEVSLHSVVSYGVLFCLAISAGMLLKRTWLLCGVFLFMVFLLGRRTELALCIAILLSYWIWNFLLNKSEIYFYTVRIIAIALMAGVLSTLLSNEVSLERWSILRDSLQERIDLVLVGLDERGKPVPDALEESSDPRQLDSKSYSADGRLDFGLHGVGSSAEEGALNDGLVKLLLGRGLGWYSKLGSGSEYPHNVLLETWLESGAVAAVLLGGILVWSLVLSFRVAVQGQSGLAIFLMIVTLLTVSMKSGDIVASARVFSFILIATSFGQPLRTG